MKNLMGKPFFAGSIFVIALAALTSMSPVSADPDAWTWTDKGGELPRRDGIRLMMAAERQSSWLLSDGSSLLRFDGTSMSDLTQEARDRGMRSIRLLSSDGRSWLVWNKNVDDSRGQLWLRDGSSWTDLTNVLPSSVDALHAEGRSGQWMLRAASRGTSRAIFLSGTNAIPSDLALPLDASTRDAGCVKESSGSTLCTGLNRAVSVNGVWYWIGGPSEARAANGISPELTSMRIWRLSGTDFVTVKNIPAAKFVSGIWSTDAGLLLATSESPMYPMSADRLWFWNGVSWRELSPQAKALGLLPADAPKLKVAYGGASWMIVSDNKLFRFDGTYLQSKGVARMSVDALSGGDGFVLTGTDANGMATLFKINDQIVDASVTSNTATANASTIASMLSGTDLRVEGIPSDAIIGEGRGFTFRANAADASNIDRIEIFVNGARIRICKGGTCEFTQTYWALLQAERKVVFQAKAWNGLGVATDSRIITLVVKQGSTAGLAPATTGSASVGLSQDFGTGMAFASWTDPAGNTLPAGSIGQYIVAGQDKLDGLASIEVWVNGTIVKTCAAGYVKSEFRCEVPLVAADYPAGTDVFMNARLADAKGNILWVPGTTLTRPVPTVIGANVPVSSSGISPLTSDIVATPIFASRLSIDPNSKDIRRGTTLTVIAKSQNNIVGLQRVEMMYGGQIRNLCRYGVAMGETTCELTIDTSTFAENTSFSFVARAIDTEGRETWSNGETVTVRGATWSPTPTVTASDATGFSQWSWLTPEVAELDSVQEATYSVGAWSPQGVKAIEIVANGSIKKTCTFASGTASRECAFILRPSDWNHGESVVVNARIRDFSGNVIWSAPKSVLMTRGWWEPVNRPGSYVNVSASRNDGYKAGETVSFTLMGWSPNGTERLELLVDGKIMASCPSDVCKWTSAPLTAEHIEFQARLIDRSGKQAWSGLYGLKQQ